MEFIKNKKEWFIAGGIILITIIVIILANIPINNIAEPEPISTVATEYNKQIILDDYPFTPKIQKNIDGQIITEVKPFGDWDYTETDYYDKNYNLNSMCAYTVWINNENNNSLKGKIGLYYKNVGYYNGKQVSLKLTYEGTDNDSLKDGFGLLFHKDSFNITTTNNNNYVKIKYTFVDEDTKENLKINGYLQFNLKNKNTINISNYDKIYYNKAEFNNLKYYENINDWNNCIQVDSKTDSILVATFSGSEIDYIWSGGSIYDQCFNKNKDNKTDIYINKYKDQKLIALETGIYLIKENGDILIEGLMQKKRDEKDSNVFYSHDFKEKYIAKKSTYELDLTESVVSHSNVTGIEQIMTTITERIPDENKFYQNEEIYYHIYASIPMSLESNYYANFVISDSFNEKYNINEIEISNATTKESLNNMFSVTKDNNKVTISAKDTSLSNSNFYGKTIKISISVSANEVNKDEIIENIVELQIDDNEPIINTSTITILKDKTDNAEFKVKINTSKDKYSSQEEIPYQIIINNPIRDTQISNIILIGSFLEFACNFSKEDINVYYSKNDNKVLTNKEKIEEFDFKCINGQFELSINKTLDYKHVIILEYKIGNNIDLSNTNYLNHEISIRSDLIQVANFSKKVNIECTTFNITDLIKNEKEVYNASDIIEREISITPSNNINGIFFSNNNTWGTNDISKYENVTVLFNNKDITNDRNTEIENDEADLNIKINRELSKDDYIIIKFSNKVPDNVNYLNYITSLMGNNANTYYIKKSLLVK